MSNASFRQLRVFVSSTFNDMRQERNVLLEKVFPMVAGYCHRRKTEFIGVDLRWGVSEDQSRRGETISVCMSEIDRCRPLFIGMIGERYGWVPEGSAISVTEQEIRYGALDAPTGTQAFFYFRSPVLTEKLCGPFDPDPRQNALKQRIRESGYPVMEDYADLDSFGRQVYLDLTAAADRLMDEIKEQTPVEAVRSDQFFQAERAAAFYVDRPDVHALLREKLEQGGLTLLTGERGSGKTAMLAKLALETGRDEQFYTFLYFVGNTEDQGWERPASQLVAELRDRFGLDIPGTEGREGLRRSVCLALHMAAAKGRIALFFDRLDALALDDGYGLSWLPEELPKGVLVIAALNDGDTLARLRLRPHSEVRLDLLMPEEAGNVAVSYLAGHSKQLSARQLALLTASEKARSPLFLITMLNEIRHIGRHNRLTEQLEDYLACEDIRALFLKVLERLDRDYDEEGTGLPRRVLTWTEAGRGGLTEGELVSLLGHVPQARFLPLMLALEPFTAVSGGAVHVSVPEFREVMRKRYGIDEQTVGEYRRELTEWFLSHPDTPRYCYVLPWLLKEAGDHTGLAGVLSDPAAFGAIWSRNRYELKEYWALLGSHGLKASDAYRPLTEDPDKAGGTAAALAEFFADTGETEIALPLLLRLTEQRSPADAAGRAAALRLLGNLRQRSGEYDKAEACYRELYEISGEAGDSYGQIRALGNLGLVSMARGDLMLARNAFERVMELAAPLNQRDAQQVALGNLGNIAFMLGDPEQAKRLYRRQKDIGLETGNPTAVINACGALGVIHFREKSFAEAERLFTEQIRLSRQIGAADSLANALGNLAALTRMSGNADAAERLLLEKLEVCRKSGLILGEQSALGNLATLAAEKGETQKALRLAKKRRTLTKRSRAFRQYAEALMQTADLEAALGMKAQAERDRLLADSLAKQHGFALRR